jgi:hypothetical protein
VTDLVTAAVWNIKAHGGRNGEHLHCAPDDRVRLERVLTLPLAAAHTAEALR